MNGKWEESKNRIIRLPTNQPATFNLYAQWLYTRRIPSGDSTFSSDTCRKEFRKLVDAYILGDQFQDTGFKNAVVDTFPYVLDMRDEEGTKFYPSSDCIKQLYEGTLAFVVLGGFLWILSSGIALTSYWKAANLQNSFRI